MDKRFLILLLISVLSGYQKYYNIRYETCHAANLCTLKAGFAAESSLTNLISPELLKHANLKILWENVLPIKKTESINRLSLLGNRVYVISDQNYILSLSRDSGKIVFAKTVAPAALLMVGMTLYLDQPLYVDGSGVVQIDAKSGVEIKTVNPGAGPAHGLTPVGRILRKNPRDAIRAEGRDRAVGGNR